MLTKEVETDSLHPETRILDTKAIGQQTSGDWFTGYTNAPFPICKLNKLINIEFQI